MASERREFASGRGEPHYQQRGAGTAGREQAIHPLAFRIALNTANGVAGMSIWSIP